MFEGIKKSLESIENRFNIFNIIEKFKNLKVINIKINTIKILYQINHSKDKALYLGQNHTIQYKNYPRPNYYFRGIGICCE